MNTRQTVLGLAGAAILACAGSMLATGCSSSNNNPTPPANTVDASASDASTAVDSSTGTADASTAADAAATDAASAITDAGCILDASNPLLGCAAFNVTCVPFTADVPDAPPL
jgi:hypothetical protein